MDGMTLVLIMGGVCIATLASLVVWLFFRLKRARSEWEDQTLLLESTLLHSDGLVEDIKNELSSCRRDGADFQEYFNRLAVMSELFSVSRCLSLHSVLHELVMKFPSWEFSPRWIGVHYRGQEIIIGDKSHNVNMHIPIMSFSGGSLYVFGERHPNSRESAMRHTYEKCLGSIVRLFLERRAAYFIPPDQQGFQQDSSSWVDAMLQLDFANTLTNLSEQVAALRRVMDTSVLPRHNLLAIEAANRATELLIRVGRPGAAIDAALTVLTPNTGQNYPKLLVLAATASIMILDFQPVLGYTAFALSPLSEQESNDDRVIRAQALTLRSIAFQISRPDMADEMARMAEDLWRQIPAEHPNAVQLQILLIWMAELKGDVFHIKLWMDRTIQWQNHLTGGSRLLLLSLNLAAAEISLGQTQRARDVLANPALGQLLRDNPGIYIHIHGLDEQG